MDDIAPLFPLLETTPRFGGGRGKKGRLASGLAVCSMGVAGAGVACNVLVMLTKHMYADHNALAREYFLRVLDLVMCFMIVFVELEWQQFLDEVRAVARRAVARRR